MYPVVFYGTSRAKKIVTSFDIRSTFSARKMNIMKSKVALTQLFNRQHFSSFKVSYKVPTHLPKYEKLVNVLVYSKEITYKSAVRKGFVKPLFFFFHNANGSSKVTTHIVARQGCPNIG